MWSKISASCFLSIFFGVVNCLHRCPPESMVSPCQCDPRNRALKCDGIESSEVLEKVFEKIHGVSLNELIISNCSMLYIPKSVLEGSKFDSITLDSCYLHSLFDSIPSEGKLSKLFINKVQVMQGFEWHYFSNIRVRDLIIKDSSIPVIDDMFRKDINAHALENLWMEKTKTEEIKDQAFSALIRVRTFSFTRTWVNSITRDMFPKLWTSIKWINLSYNRFKNLPADIFDDMPHLHIVLLEKNFLTTVPETVRKGSQITYQLRGNPINCDCSMKWIVQSGKKQVMGECMEPAEWRGRDFIILEPQDFAYCG